MISHSRSIPHPIESRKKAPLVLLGLGGVHGQGVQESTGDGDGGSDDGSGGHGRLEGDDGRDDDDDALDGVADGVGDRVDLSEGQEGDLVVGVVGGTAKGEENSEALVGEVAGGDDVLEGREEAGSLHSEHGGDEDEGGHGREDRVQVLGVEVLADLLSAHGLLGKDAAGGRRDVREHRGGEGEDGEAELLHGGDGDAADDGEEGGVDQGGELLAEEEEVEEAGDDGLGRLDDVGEGDGAGAEGDDGADVDAGVAEGDGEEGLEVAARELGGLAEAEEPHGNEVQDAGGHLDGGDGPGVVQHVQGLLVVDVVPDVEQVPQGEVRADLERLHQVSAALALGVVHGGRLGPAGQGHRRHLVHGLRGLGKLRAGDVFQGGDGGQRLFQGGGAGDERPGRGDGGREGQDGQALLDGGHHGGRGGSRKVLGGVSDTT
mmetsp:Transcript_30194/g.61580  ORF Transcript_30194/g.61580 Transcript_30194/m.61580 type:complete len:432 (-) Transcript_30194:61-1356(-)